jgi:hypothetical protein
LSEFPAGSAGQDVLIELFLARFMTEEIPHPPHSDMFAKAESSAQVVYHPSAKLYDVVFATALPIVEAFAEAKNVPLEPAERVPVLQHALQAISRTTMRRLLKNNPAAVRTIQFAISHSLDVFASGLLLAAFMEVQGIPVPDSAILTQAGEAAMKVCCANDKDPTHIVWPDIGKMKEEYRRRLPEQEAEVPVLTLPEAVSKRVTVRAPAKLWVPFIRSVTPGGDTLPRG